MRGVSTSRGGEEQHQEQLRVMTGIWTYIDPHLTCSSFEFKGVVATSPSQLIPMPILHIYIYILTMEIRQFMSIKLLSEMQKCSSLLCFSKECARVPP